MVILWISLKFVNAKITSKVICLTNISMILIQITLIIIKMSAFMILVIKWETGSFNLKSKDAAANKVKIGQPKRVHGQYSFI